MRVLLVGIDYFGHRGSGDKNFWFEMMPMLASQLASVAVLSFNYRPTDQDIQPPDTHIFNTRPAHVGIDFRPDNANQQNPDKCHLHFNQQPRSLVERSLSILKSIPLIRRLKAELGFNWLHFMDNFGPSMGYIGRFVPDLQVSAAAAGYHARGRYHDRYLAASFSSVDTIVAYCEAYRLKLIHIGLPRNRVMTIPWGVKPDSSSIQPMRQAAKQSLGLSLNTTLVLWTGFIAQIGEADFFAALSSAQNVLSTSSNNALFVFAFKPECYKPEYSQYAQDGIQITCTEQGTFSTLLKAADILLSPVTNTSSIITPPLSWLEAMNLGIPIITTRVPGIDAVVDQGVNGYYADAVEDVAQLTATCIEKRDYLLLGINARAHVHQHYNLHNIVHSYTEIWR